MDIVYMKIIIIITLIDDFIYIQLTAEKVLDEQSKRSSKNNILRLLFYILLFKFCLLYSSINYVCIPTYQATSLEFGIPLRTFGSN